MPKQTREFICPSLKYYNDRRAVLDGTEDPVQTAVATELFARLMARQAEIHHEIELEDQ